MNEIGIPVLRMKVNVDLSKPLPCGFYVREDTDWVEKDWASFKYKSYLLYVGFVVCLIV